MKKRYAKEVIHYIKHNPGVFYDDLLLQFPDKKDGQLYALLYGLCSLKKSEAGELESILIFKEREGTRSLGNLLGGRRAIEMGEFSLTRESYSKKRLDEIFDFWKLGNI